MVYNQVMKHEQIAQQLPDYVLGLLPLSQRHDVERHTAVCPDCRQALQAERRLSLAVRSTLQSVTQPDGGRLSQLMPKPPRRRSSFVQFIWQKQLAPVCLLLLFLGSFGLRWSNEPSRGWLVPSATHLAITATYTSSPTATLSEATEAWPGKAETAPISTRATTEPAPALAITPAPIATPIAALSVLRSN